MKKVVIQKFVNMLMNLIKDKDGNIWHDACKPTLMYDKNAIVGIKTEDIAIGINTHNEFRTMVFDRNIDLDTIKYIEKLIGIINDLKIENEYLQKYNTYLENQLKNKK